MKSCWLCCWLMAMLNMAAGAKDESTYDWTESIRPGMTRARLEKIVFTPDSDGDLSRRFYETRHAHVEEYPFDDGWAMIVPFEPLPRTDFGTVPKAHFNAQKVAAKPWMIVDKVVTVGEAKEPYLHFRLPGEAGRDAKRPEEHAQILAGDLFRNGREVALVAYSNQDGTNYGLDALAFYRKTRGSWTLRSFFPTSDSLRAFGGEDHFVSLQELSGDQVPEVVLLKLQARNPSCAIFKYDGAADRLALAIDEIINPGREGTEVSASEHNGAGSFVESLYAWRGNNLVLQSRTSQDHHGSDPGWIYPLKPPEEMPDDWQVRLWHAERNAATGAIDSWQSLGNVGWVFGGANFGDNSQKLVPLLWTVFQIGQLRRTILIRPEPKALAARSIKREDVEFSNALFARPDQFSGNAKVNLPHGRTARLKDLAKVEIRDEWPMAMSTTELHWPEKDSHGIAPLSLWIGRQTGSFEDVPPIPPEWARSIRQHRSTSAAPRFTRTTPIAVYLAGPDCDSTQGCGLRFEDVKLEPGNILRVTCETSGKPATTPELTARPALAVNLGRLAAGNYRAVVEFNQAGDESAKTIREVAFQIDR